MTADLFDNPLGLDGFEFVEFCATEGRAGAGVRSHPHMAVVYPSNMMRMPRMYFSVTTSRERFPRWDSL
jgi:hypothetical protein